MSPSPELSVIVPVRRAQKTIRATLQALSDQCQALPVEIIAVISENDPSWSALKHFEAPGVRMLAIPGQWGVPQLRRDGVYQSRAPWIAITEDHCLFPQHWLARLTGEAKGAEGEIVGGPVTNGRTTFVGWAQYFTRYSGFMLPLTESFTTALPGNNAVYPRSTLMENLHLIRDGFWEAELNQALIAAKHRFRITPSLEVRQHQHRGILEYVTLRFQHGRCYGARRIAATERSRRRALYCNMPLIPIVLFFRAARAVFRKKSNRLRFIFSSPLLAVYFVAWASGESVGYLMGANEACMDTD